MSQPHFDLRALFEAIDAERGARQLSWAALSRLVGVSASTIRRFGDADDAEADGVLALIRWLGVPPETFVTHGSVDGTVLPMPGERVVRVDMDLVRAAIGTPAVATGSSRTTIQRLTAAAQSAGASVTSLTRLSDL